LDKIKTRSLASQDLYNVLHILIAPTAKCLKTALGNGTAAGLIRQTLMPFGNTLEQMVLGNADAARREFWVKLHLLAPQIASIGIAKNLDCSGIVERYGRFVYPEEAPSDDVADDKRAYPGMTAYRDLPYLCVLSAALMHFLEERDISVRILNQTADGDRADYAARKMLATLRYYQGQLTSSAVQPLTAWHETILQHRQRIDEHCKMFKCDNDMREKSKELDLRERKAELVMMNNFAYFVAEDLARGVKDANQFEEIARDYAERLRKAVDDHDIAVAGSADDFVDTYAYTTLVLQARRPDPDVEVFKKLARKLEGVIERYELKARDPRNQFDASGLRIARSHLASARELAGE
jgi:hypothetical protein